MESQLIKFYRGIEPDSSGRLISEIWQYSFIQLENIHNYIQWLFPLPEKSNFNSSAPRLTELDIKIFRIDDRLQSNITTSFETSVNFYGFSTIIENGTCVLSPNEFFAQRTENWVTPYNHNFLRITRILKFLKLVEQQKLLDPLFQQLEELYLNHPGVIGYSFEYWKSAAHQD